MNDFIELLAANSGISKSRVKYIIKNGPFLYKDYFINKNDGSKRLISVPRSDLKSIQKSILKDILYKKISPNPYVHGGVIGRSIVTNAKNHVGKKCVVCLDIKNFFPSTHMSKLEKSLLNYFSANEAKILIRLTTKNYSLPQGAPTSPFLSNLALSSCDEDIKNFCLKSNLDYSRYFDDITISGNGACKFLSKITKIINQSGFSTNLKTKIQHEGKEQIVTGIVVNKKMTLRSSDIKLLKTVIESFKVNGFLAFETDNFVKELEIINGKIAFLNQVNFTLGGKLNVDFSKIRKDLGL